VEEIKEIKAEFDPAGLKGDLLLGHNNIRIYMEGVPGSGSCTLTNSLTRKANSASFKIIRLCAGGVIAVGIKCLKKKIGKDLLFFS